MAEKLHRGWVPLAAVKRKRARAAFNKEESNGHQGSKGREEGLEGSPARRHPQLSEGFKQAVDGLVHINGFFGLTSMLVGGFMNHSSIRRRCLALDALFEGGRMFVGATAVTYLLHTGVTLPQVAALKSVQALVIILGELPTGVFADTFGRRRSLFTAAACAAAGAALFYAGKTFPVFVLAEALAALSICFWSGAYEAYVIDAAALDKEPALMDRFFHLDQAVTSGVVMGLGLLGGVLGSFGLSLPYLAAIGAFLLIGALLAGLPSDQAGAAGPDAALPWRAGLRRHLEASLRQGLLHPALLPFFAANVVVQLMIQPILHYWQPFFQALSPVVDPVRQGVVFASYCGTSALFGFLYGRLSGRPWARSRGATAGLFFAFACLYLGLSGVRGWPAALILFALLQGVLSVARTSLAIRMNEAIGSESRASILSAVSLFSRFGMVGALALTAGVLGGGASTAAGVQTLYRVFAALSVCVCGAALAFVILGRAMEASALEVPAP